jgi:hypothetical protein
MWPTGTATRRRLARASTGLLGLLMFLSACRPPAATQAPTRAVDQPQSAPQAGPQAETQSKQQSARLPGPGVYVLRRVSGLPLPADLKPPDYDPRRGGYFERDLAGRLYLEPDGDYYTLICADVVDSAGRVPNALDGGANGGRYWAAGGRVYFSDLVTDALPDSIAVRVQGDTIELVRNLYVRDRTISLAAAFSRGPPLPESVCPAVRDSLERGAHPKPSDVIRDVSRGTHA